MIHNVADHVMTFVRVYSAMKPAGMWCSFGAFPMEFACFGSFMIACCRKFTISKATKTKSSCGEWLGDPKQRRSRTGSQLLMRC